VFEIVDGGVPLNKVVFGKPVTFDDVYNTGFVQASYINSFYEQATVLRPTYTGSLMNWVWRQQNQGIITTYYNEVYP